MSHCSVIVVVNLIPVVLIVVFGVLGNIILVVVAMMTNLFSLKCIVTEATKQYVCFARRNIPCWWIVARQLHLLCKEGGESHPKKCLKHSGIMCYQECSVVFQKGLCKEHLK